MRNKSRSLMLVALLFIVFFSFLDVAKAQISYDPGDFIYRVSSNESFDVGTAPTSDVASAISGESANALVAGYTQQFFFLTIGQMQKSDIDMKPIRTSLGVVGADQFVSDGPGAQAAAVKAAQQLATFKAGSDLQGVKIFATNAANQDLFKMVSSFYQYEALLELGVAQAQTVQHRVTQYLNNNEAGKGLLAGAALFENTRYQKGKFDCSAIVRLSAADMGLPVPSGNTTTWFTNGMGKGWQQIYGGSSGLTTGKLIADLTSGPSPLVIPPGSIIVTDGHAAIYVSTIQVAGQPEILVYDANNSDGWVLSVDGVYPPGSTVPSSVDLPPAVVAFPGNRVGLHVTRWQWDKTHSELIKVFQPIAEPANLVDARPGMIGGAF